MFLKNKLTGWMSWKQTHGSQVFFHICHADFFCVWLWKFKIRSCSGLFGLLSRLETELLAHKLKSYSLVYYIIHTDFTTFTIVTKAVVARTWTYIECFPQVLNKIKSQLMDIAYLKWSTNLQRFDIFQWCLITSDLF